MPLSPPNYPACRSPAAARFAIFTISARRSLIVATDRVSAFDVVLPDPIPDKGRVLNGLAAYWFDQTGTILPNHLLTADCDDFPQALAPFGEILAGRSMLVRKTRVLPVECVVRGYLAGSAWSEYQKHGPCG